MNKNLLLIFLKYPEEGQVKTRLAKTIGPKNAVAIYREFIDIIIAKTDSDDYERKIFVEPLGKKDDLRALLQEDIDVVGQEGDDLGSRLFNAFKDVFVAGAQKVVVVGSDIPLIDEVAISRAFDLLGTCDCVLGTSEDGGYYLLGMKCFLGEVFRDIQWGTQGVLRQSIDKLKKQGASFFLLEKRFDIDLAEDLYELHSLLKEGEYLKDRAYDKLRECIVAAIE